MAKLSAVSARRVEANRRNARKSTGPRTAEGKARSSRNAVTHGIFCSDAVVQDEDRQVFETLRAELIEEHKPQTITELFLVDRMAVGMWRLRRVQSAEQMAHLAAGDEMIHARRQARELLAEQEDDERPWACVNEAEEDQNEEDEEDEEDEDPMDPREVSASVTTYGLMLPRDGQRQAAVLERLSLYEKRIEGTVHRCLSDLRKLRTPARGERVPEEPSPYLAAVIDDEAEPSPPPSPGVPGEGVVGAAEADGEPAGVKPLTPALSPFRGEGVEALAGDSLADLAAPVENEAIGLAADVARDGRLEGEDHASTADHR